MAIKVDSFREEVVGLQPLYTDKGDATVIYLREGEILIGRGIRALVAALTRSYAIDLSSQRINVEMRLQRSGVLPFYLGPKRVFVPLKMRKPIAAKDMVYGYLDISYIKEWQIAGKGRCLLSFEPGRQLEILSHLRTLNETCNQGRRLLEMLQGEQVTDQGEKMAVEVTLYYHNSIKGIQQSLQELKELLISRRGDLH